MALQPKDCKPSAICISDLKTALQSNKIVNASSEELSEVLKYAMMIVGIRGANIPFQSDFDFMKQFVVRNFGSHTTDEIKLAFDMAVAGKLEVDARAFENFSCEYIGRIMAAYRKWAVNEHRNMPAPIDESKLLSAPEIEVDWSNVWADILQAAKEGRIETKIIGVPIYDWLESKGELKLSFAEKAIIYNQQKVKLRLELSELIMSKKQKPQDVTDLQLLIKDEINEDLKVRIGNLAKIAAVRQYALKCIEI